MFTLHAETTGTGTKKNPWVGANSLPSGTAGGSDQQHRLQTSVQSMGTPRPEDVLGFPVHLGV